VKISCLPLRERRKKGGNVSDRIEPLDAFSLSLSLSLFFPRAENRARSGVTARWSSTKREKGGKDREREKGKAISDGEVDV